MGPVCIDALAVRSQVLQSIRAFFIERGSLEVETPVRLATPALELHIDAEPSGDHYLRTSPELHMKRLLAAGCDTVFQIGPCFRRGERGAHHSPEFTMLEWYRAPADYSDILKDTKELIRAVSRELRSTLITYRGIEIDLFAEWEDLTVSEAFQRWAGWDPVAAFDADRFDLDLVGRVEPRFAADRPTVLRDYPVEQAALARISSGESAPVAERWELYIGGLELANAFGELTDPIEQRRRFNECARRRNELEKDVYQLDEGFLAALEQGLPDCAGVALGVDRLVMLLTDSACIDDVRAFSCGNDSGAG